MARRNLQNAYNTVHGEWIRGGVKQTEVTEVEFSDKTTAKIMAVVPKGATILSIEYKVTEAFNASTTNTLSIGTTLATPNEYVHAVDCTDLGTDDRLLLPVGNATPLAANLTIYAKVGATGDAATTGKAVVIVEFV